MHKQIYFSRLHLILNIWGSLEFTNNNNSMGGKGGAGLGGVMLGWLMLCWVKGCCEVMFSSAPSQGEQENKSRGGGGEWRRRGGGRGEEEESGGGGAGLNLFQFPACAFCHIFAQRVETASIIKQLSPSGSSVCGVCGIVINNVLSAG